MAKFVLTDVSVTLNAVDLSDHVKSVTLTREVEALETSTMSTASREYAVGPNSWSGTINFTEDYAAGEVNATLSTIFAGGAAVTLACLPVATGGVGATNPSFTGSVILTSIPMIDGDWGSVAETGINFQGTGTLTRATS